MKLKFTQSAETEFLLAVEYIRERSPQAARDFRRRAGRALKRLARFPESGRTLPEFPQGAYREVIVGPYRFFCRVTADDATVLTIAVWHGAQLAQPPENENS